MPRILHNPATQLIPQRRLHQPPPKPLIIPPRPLQNFLPGNAKLRTTRRTHSLGHGLTGKQLHEAGLEVLAGMHVLAVGVGEGVDLGGAAEDPGAAEVDVAVVEEVLEAEVFEHGEAVVVGVVVVPLVALRVEH